MGASPLGLIDGWTRRLYAGMRYDRNVFAQVPGTPTPAAELPPDRTLSYPFIAVEILQDDYRKVGDQNQIGRTEDLYFGTHLYAEIGYSGDGLWRKSKRTTVHDQRCQRLSVNRQVRNYF